MIEIKVSQLPTTTTMLGPDLLMIVSGANNKKITFANMIKSIRTDLIVNSENEAAALKVFSQSGDNLLISDPVLGRIGVGTITPAALLHVNGNLKLGDNAISGVLINSYETISIDGTTKTAVPGIGITRFVFDAASTSGVVNLSNGIPYQTKTFIVSETPTGGTCNINIVPTPWIDAAASQPSITLTKLGDTITFVYDETGWTVQSYFGASIV